MPLGCVMLLPNARKCTQTDDKKLDYIITGYVSVWLGSLRTMWLQVWVEVQTCHTHFGSISLQYTYLHTHTQRPSPLSTISCTKTVFIIHELLASWKEGKIPLHVHYWKPFWPLGSSHNAVVHLTYMLQNTHTLTLA